MADCDLLAKCKILPFDILIRVFIFAKLSIQFVVGGVRTCLGIQLNIAP